METNKCPLRPINGRVVVKRLEEPEDRTSSIFVVTQQGAGKLEVLYGEVMAVSDGTLCSNGTLAPCTVMVGDKVRFCPIDSSEVRVQGETYMILRSLDILCKVVTDEEGNR